MNNKIVLNKRYKDLDKNDYILYYDLDCNYNVNSVYKFYVNDDFIGDFKLYFKNDINIFSKYFWHYFNDTFLNYKGEDLHKDSFKRCFFKLFKNNLFLNFKHKICLLIFKKC